MKNYYDILGVTEDASKDTIRKAFKEIAKKEHPDRGGDESKFKEANEAYDTLKDSKKRQEYDTIRKFGQPGTGGNFSFRSGDFFGELALLDEEPRSASAICTVHSRLIGFFRTDLLTLINRYPELGNKILLNLSRVLGERLRETNKNIIKSK